MQSTMSILDDVRFVIKVRRQGGAEFKRRSVVQTFETMRVENDRLKAEIERLQMRDRRVGRVADELVEMEPALADAAEEALANQLEVAAKAVQADLKDELDAVDFETRILEAAEDSARRLYQGALNVGEAQKKSDAR